MAEKAMETVGRPNIAVHRLEWPERAFLSCISDRAAQTYFSVGNFVRYAPRETMIREGAADRTVHLLISGCVKVISKQGTQSAGTLLAVRVGGDVVGELATIDERRRSAGVEVCSWQPALVCVIDGVDFLRVLDSYPEDHVALSRVIGSKLRAATRRRVDIGDCPPVTRMARMLVELAEDYGQPSHDQRSVMIRIGLTQAELGSLIGISKATAERALRSLREAGLVGTAHRPLMIYDMAGLRVTAQLDD
ncbi:Crp/Fnr family transcriptional regulator [Actinophytocola sp.]|uniref:Crp/Fnr family transcriptional regulator n=1 Tax=Actinophytocola sp. TaxID=1872138 RepID=UPI002ED37EFF